MEDKNRLVKRIIMIVIAIILLLLLIRCASQGRKLPNTGGDGETVVTLTQEQELFAEMKKDEEYLFLLYQRADICSDPWIQEFLELAEKFQNYTYTGEFTEINIFLEEYADYGIQLEEIGDFFLESDFGASLEKIEEIEGLSGDMEDKLNDLSKKYNEKD